MRLMMQVTFYIIVSMPGRSHEQGVKSNSSFIPDVAVGVELDVSEDRDPEDAPVER